MPGDDDTAMSGDGDTDPTGEPSEQLFDGRAGSLRDATESGPLFTDAYRPGESNEEGGLVAGDSTDPVLVAGVGYPLLGDLALGTVVAYRVAGWDLKGVAVADCSHTPVAAYQTITAGDYESVLLVGTEKRGGDLNDGSPSESPGAIHEYEVADFEVDETDVVQRIGESAMGSNTVENVVVVSEALGELPDDTRIFAVEPGYDSWGMTVDEFTEPVEDALDDMLDRVLAALDDALGDVDRPAPS
jgi:Ni,Fe-hydrogenase maturation factor